MFQGLWGERIFRSFDTESKGHLTLKDLLTGLITYCKSTEEEKIKILFDLYDIDDDGYIQKKELVTMVKTLLFPSEILPFSSSTTILSNTFRVFGMKSHQEVKPTARINLMKKRE